MERMTDTPNTIEVFENDIELYLQQFAERDFIDDFKTVPQSVWNAALRYVQKHVFADKSVIKSKVNIYNNSIPSNCNSYDYELVNNICDIYIDLCFRYNKEISILGFSNLTGIDNETINIWGNDNSKYNIYNNINNNGINNYNSNKLSTSSFGIYKKLCNMREESLSNKLVDGKQNPVGTIAVLNRQFGWASPYTSDANKRSKAALGNAELPKLGENQQQIAVIDSKNVID